MLYLSVSPQDATVGLRRAID